MATFGALAAGAEKRLSSLEYADPVLEARELLGIVLQADCRSPGFEGLLRREADKDAEERLSALIERRLSGEPLQYIIGEWEFYGLTFSVGRGVLIPRQDTELIVETAEKLFANADSLRVLDLCAGTGCIGLTLEKRLKNVSLTLVEKYDEALAYLRENLRRHGSKAQLIQGDVTDEGLAEGLPEFDLIVCNPPYLTSRDMACLQREVSAEPGEALFGGEDGLDFYRAVTRIWKNAIRQGGVMLFEIGAAQRHEVVELMIQHGFRDVRCRRDLSGNDRAVSGFKR
ncbi:MAG: peptide chain release factor N(5)-glutamine methyltransferase [Ruminococcus sp.]|nr:peptide chain release factor N(5)-glutamine methyltransferase [Ruminococcus sp.]